MSRPEPADALVAPVNLMGHITGALLAVCLLGSQYLVTWILVGRAVAWVAGLLAALWVAAAVLGLPRLRRRMRGRPAARRLVDGTMTAFVLMVPLQAVLFSTFGLFVAGTTLGLGDGLAHPGASFAVGSLYVALFLAGFGGLLPAGTILIAGGSGVVRRLLGGLAIAAGLAVGLGAGFYLDRALEPLIDAWPPGRLSMVIFTVEAALSAALVLALRPAFSQRGWRAVACSPDGTQVLVARDRRALLLGPGAARRDLPVGGRLAAFSPCGRWAAVADVDGAVVLFEAPAFRPRLRLTEGHGTPTAAAFCPDLGLLALGDDDGFVLVFRITDGALVLQAETGLDAAATVAFDGRALVTMDRNHRLVAVPLDGGAPTPPARCEDFVAGESVPTFPRPFLAPGAQRLALATGQRLTFWQRRGDRWVPRPAGPEAPLMTAQVAFSPSGDHVAAIDHRGTVRVWAWDDERPRLALDGQPQPPNAIALSADGAVLVAAGPSVRIFDVPHGRSRSLWPVQAGAAA